MNVFISWSEPRSQKVAELLRRWIRCVLQASHPWVSNRIDRGALWFAEINEQLKDTSVGIICLTPENKENPWIMFEAGAIAKGLSSNRVCTFLIELSPAEVRDPLGQFNHTLPTREGVFSLVETLNSCLGSAGLESVVLQTVFDTYWPQFEESYREILKNTPVAKPVEKEDGKDMLAEILLATRSLSGRLSSLEARSTEAVDAAKRSGGERRRRMLLAEATKMFERGIYPKAEIVIRLKDLGYFEDEIQWAISHFYSVDLNAKNEGKPLDSI